MPVTSIYQFLDLLVEKYPSRKIPKNVLIAEICNHFNIFSQAAIKNKFDFLLRQQLIHAGKTGWIIDYKPLGGDKQ